MNIGEKKGKTVIKKVPVRPGELVPIVIPVKMPAIKTPEPAQIPAKPVEVPNVRTVGN